MPTAAITSISEAGIAYQWHSESGKTRQSAHAPWEALERVTAFKRDLFAYDLICLELVTANAVIEFDEEDPRWKELVRTMPDHLAGCCKWGQWFTSVAFPAFETNKQTLFERRTGL